MNIRAVKGMNDILPADVARWQAIESGFRRHAEAHGFGEVRTPAVEPTALFVRSIGETTDVVEKEMYTFDRHKTSLTLRPEGTAGAARAFLQHKAYATAAVNRWYYIGPMFRGERPARGRYRQFHQAGAEIYGDAGPYSDAELISMLVEFFDELGIKELRVQVNSLGSEGTREAYRQALLEYFSPHREELSQDSQRRLEKNPLRILDSKAPQDQSLCENAPSILDVLSKEDVAHFDELRRSLDELAVPYEVAPRLVRGLDYYTRTLFEVQGSGGELGAQNALCGGGRYDGMISSLGGPKTPCIGFAMGIERLLLAMTPPKPGPGNDVYVCPLGERAQRKALAIARDLRRGGVGCTFDGRGQKLKVMLHRAEQARARYALILGDGELERGELQLKHLAKRQSESVKEAELLTTVTRWLAEDNQAEGGTA